MDTPASSHDHPLVLNHTMHNRHELASLLHCNKCGYAIVRGSFYSCFHCGYHLHYHCAVTMPPKINHPFHPQHPLSWCIIGSFTCAFCYPHDSNFLNPLREEYYSYSCIEYNLKLDIECALAPTITCYDDQTRPLCHLQPMDLVEKEDGLSFSACCVCESPSRFGSSTYYYYCKICEFSVHKSCTNFSRDIMHPFHPKHRLFLHFSYGILDCSSCGRDCCYRFNFRCKECDVNVCIRCTFLRPCIRYQGHDHLLCYVNYVWKFYSRTSCDADDAYCKQYSMGDLSEFNWSRNHVLRCVPCQFNLHLLCGPLPSVIKHKCHIHPLTLVDSLIEDDSGEYYCDSCEKERDPRLCVYYCEGCKYVAHVQCVISEVLRVLKGELKDVELRIVGQNELDTEIMEKNLVLDKEKEESALVGEQGKASMTLMDLVSELSKRIGRFALSVSRL
ncbi:uncharacterized protein LOC112488864 isoform X1 [Ziziphus jujuba]|uniref:Uncharacterized protein LOC112488864 isoform X1 n=1 Tax=Ziziphus jujuba TaxID=326968 RepID=A0A6P6GFR2_ZIZJJ|nr:uncharacterized protein LOC112488864 isoform X1 [Ziziphus jujuba]